MTDTIPILFYSTKCKYCVEFARICEEHNVELKFECLDLNEQGQIPQIVYDFGLKYVPSLQVSFHEPVIEGRACFKWLKDRLLNNKQIPQVGGPGVNSNYQNNYNGVAVPSIYNPSQDTGFNIGTGGFQDINQVENFMDGNTASVGGSFMTGVKPTNEPIRRNRNVEMNLEQINKERDAELNRRRKK